MPHQGERMPVAIYGHAARNVKIVKNALIPPDGEQRHLIPLRQEQEFDVPLGPLAVRVGDH